MENNTKSAARGFLLAVLIVTSVALMARASGAGPSKEDLERRDKIEENQKVLAKTRQAAKEFNAAKLENERLVKELNANGWNVDWQSLDLVAVPKPEKKKASKPQASASVDVDLDKLAKAVAQHETGGCKLGSGKTHNNCFGIMTWASGKRAFKRYASKEDSYADFKRIWSTHYKRYPDIALAKKYSGNDRPHQWLANVNHFYETL